MSGFLSGSNWIMDVPNTGVDKYRPEYTSRSIPLEDLKRLHDAGASGVFCWALWNRIEPEMNWYDWHEVDEQVNRARAAGLKVLMLGPSQPPAWMPDAWYCKFADQFIARDRHPGNIVQTWPCLSPWNDDAQAHQNAMIERLCTRYNSDDVLVIGCHSQDGEAILPPAGAAIYDDAAIADYRRWVGDEQAMPNPDAPACKQWIYLKLSKMLVGQQEIYVNNPTRTISMQLHPVYCSPMWRGSGLSESGPEWPFMELYYSSVANRVKPDEFIQVVFQYFDGGFNKLWPRIHAIHRTYNTTLVTGSEFSRGLRTHTQEAIDAGIDALLTAPIHPFLKKDAVDDEDVAALAYSAGLYKERHELLGRT